MRGAGTGSWRRGLGAGLLGALALGGSASAAAPNDGALFGAWRIAGNPYHSLVTLDVRLTEVSGRAGCTSWGGNLSARDGAWRYDQPSKETVVLIVHESACWNGERSSKAANAYWNRALRVLWSATGYSLKGRTLTIRNAKGDQVVFVRDRGSGGRALPMAPIPRLVCAEPADNHDDGRVFRAQVEAGGGRFCVDGGCVPLTRQGASTLEHHCLLPEACAIPTDVVSSGGPFVSQLDVIVDLASRRFELRAAGEAGDLARRPYLDQHAGVCSVKARR